MPIYFEDSFLKINLIINITDNIDIIAQNILSCKEIISSSLHGIIYSHSLNKNAYWVIFNDFIGKFKFYDYLSVFDNFDNDMVYYNVINEKFDITQMLYNKKYIPVPKDIYIVKQNIYSKILDTMQKYNFNRNKYYINYHNDYDASITLKKMIINCEKENFIFSRLGGIEFDIANFFLNR